ncbi:hypothetical protein C4D60_Mb07t20200 [Musa balbisiana]|uniref:beta-galactosidase n=1 Tax=Musa balbisiana TaxID=52838 RepID=A0A4V4H6T3_MUSBA|nr:hypothetical protein C4D60_Mb07t20200 [Musa balbisiana]
MGLEPMTLGCGRRLSTLLLLAVTLVVVSPPWLSTPVDGSVSYDHKAIIINGRRRILISGSIHYPRSTPEYYFGGNYDLVRFIKLVKQAGLYVHLRIGPYVCAEWNFGGFPVWLKYVPGINFRTDNGPFKAAMAKFTTKIVAMMKSEGLFESQGGPIILSQINACNGFYCDYFSPNKPYKPTIWTEAWTGWFTAFGGPVPHRPVEDLAFAVARFIQKGGSFVNYYMYHGGTNFGRTAGGPFISTSYDYDAPIDEYGLLRQPKWGHLRDLHKAIKMCEPALVSGDPTVTKLGSYQEAHVYRSKSGSCAAFLSNFNPHSYASVTFNGMKYNIPSWSISILPDCKTSVFNTAKNVGNHFETWNAGVLGPVTLEGLNEGKRDLSSQKWIYQIGLRGESLSIHTLSGSSSVEWGGASTKQPLTWYKAFFNAPAGNEPLALDMSSMGKDLFPPLRFESP